MYNYYIIKNKEKLWNRFVILCFLENRRVAIFYSVTSFHLYLIEHGIPHSFEDNEIGLWDAEGYWYC